MNIEQSAMQLISYGGEGRSLAMDSIRLAREGNILLSLETLKKSNLCLKQGKEVQEMLLNSESKGEVYNFSVLLVHALDHYMNAKIVYDLAQELVVMYQTRYNIKSK